MKLFIINILLSLMAINISTAQEIYISRRGVMIMKAKNGDSIQKYRYKNIIVKLNYERPQLDLYFKLDDNLSAKVPSNRFYFDHDIKINTRLSIPYINTEAHPDIKFDAKGELIYNEQVFYIQGYGTLKHYMTGDEIPCTLTMKLKLLDSQDLSIDQFGDIYEFNLYQLVLNNRSAAVPRNDNGL